MQPPALGVCLASVLRADRQHVRLHVLKRPLVQGRLVQRYVGAEVDDPHTARPSGHVQAVGPRPHHLGVAAAVGVRAAQHRSGKALWDVKGAALGVAHEGDAEVLRQPTHAREVQAGGQVGVDGGDQAAVKRPLGLGAVVVADDRHVDSRTLDHPLLI
jgi:hypothetical protein